MMLRTPAQRKRRVESQLEEGDNITHNPKTPNSNNQFLIYEDLPLAQHSHDHSVPTTSDSMLCTYQCRQMVKSDFFEALSSAEKQARDYQSKFEALTDDFSRTESERKKFRDQFLNLEQELAAAKGREHMLQEQLKKEVDLSHERLRTQIQSYNELEIKFQNEIDLRTKAEFSAAKSEEKASLLEGKLGTLSESTTREKNRLQTVLEQLGSESKLSVSRIRADLERMECRAEGAERELALLKEQSQELKKQLDECMREKFEVEKKLSTPSTEAPSKDSDILVKLLQEELRNFESEVSEARKIKASHENVALLKEKLHEEKSRRERAELNLLKLSDLQTSVTNLDNELSKWKSLINTIPGVSIADDIPLKFAALQKEVVDSINKAGEAQAVMKKHQVAVENAVVHKQNAETEAAMVKEKEKSYKAEIGRLELMLASTVAERDHLKNVVKELTKSKHVEGGTELVSRSVVQELEASLDRKENYGRELESSLLEQKEVNNSNHNEIRLLNERLLNEKERVKYLEREGDRLERECAHFRSEISRLEAKLGCGDYSPSNTQVLRMVNTLAVENEAKKTIEALQNELQKTKEKLQAVDELKKQSPDAGTHVDSYIAAKIKQLKEQIATLEKREERYKTVFAERISVFRRACCELFGYKILMDDHQRADGISVTRFILHSIYAMTDDEKLQFEYESGNTSIVANAYTSQRDISQQVEIFIKKMNSIPAFTANLTVESFNRRTLS